MSRLRDLPTQAAKRLAWPLRLTFAGMLAERVARAFWPLWSLALGTLALLMLGFHESLPLEVVWSLGVAVAIGTGAALVFAAQRFRWPRRREVIERLDATLPGRPIAAVSDIQAIGAGDAASEAVWEAHLTRMAARLAAARAPEPDLRLAARDRYALRYVALLFFTIAVLFGSVFRVASVTELTPGGRALAAGPAWEGWVEPPVYTGQPSLYLNDIDRAGLKVPEGSRVTVRLYGKVGALTLSETVSGRTENVPPATAPEQSFQIKGSGEIAIDGPGGRKWKIDVIKDQPPTIALTGPVVRGQGGRTEMPFHASDDYGVTGGQARITLDLAQVDRRYGLAADPEPRDPVLLDLPMTITGDRADFDEKVIEDLTKNPWANLPVVAQLTAVDAAGNEGRSVPTSTLLPGRRFFDPLARAIVEQRRDLLWNRSNATRVAQVLRAVSYKPEGLFKSDTTYLKLRVAIRRLETRMELARLDDATVDETAEALWNIAVEIEDGDLSNALERLRRAQDRLSDAIKNGATDQEIAQLMQELRDAMQDYMRQLAEQSQGQKNQQLSDNQNMQTITPDQLQEMLNRLQELMQQGRTAEAQQLLDQLRQMMENMQVARGQQGQQGPGQQAMNGLADTLKQQQGLSDEAFRDLQEQFNPNSGQQGQSQNNTGRSGQQGQGQQHGQTGQGQGQDGNQQGPGGLEGDLADRQQALRQELNRQAQNLPGAGTPEGDAARDALGRAGTAMDKAEQALRQKDYAGALDNQSQAMEALRDGMRNLADQIARQQQQQNGGQGDALGRNGNPQNRDPLGRDTAQNGRIGTDQNLLQGDDVYRRAREILDEIRRRAAERQRPNEELDYLKRLLEQF